MKSLIHTTILCLLVAFVISCDNDDDDDPKHSVVGEWKGDHSQIKATYGAVVLYDESDEDYDDVLLLKDDGTAKLTRDGTVSEGTYEHDGDELTLNLDMEIEGVELSDVTFDIEELTETEMHLHLDRDQEVQLPEYGTVITTIEADLHFTK